MSTAEQVCFRNEMRNGVLFVSFSATRLQDSNAILVLERELLPVLRQSKYKAVALDLTHLEYMSSIGAGLITLCKQTLDEHGGRLVVCGLQPAVLELFSLMRIDRVVRFFGSQGDVVAAVEAGERLEPNRDVEEPCQSPAARSASAGSSTLLKRPGNAGSGVHFVSDPTLKRLIRLWPSLPADVRNQILIMMDDADARRAS